MPRVPNRSRPRRVALLILVLGGLCGGVLTARGDWMIVSPFGMQVWEPGQQALILIDEEAGQEDLFIQVDFIGDTRDFGWIVPTPGLPTLAEAGDEIFRDCALLTQPLHRRRGDGFGCTDNEHWATPADARDGGVIIYDEQTVGIYQTLTLGAEDAVALTDSLQAWGYLHGGNQEAVTSALDFYIDRDWYFVAMRVDSSSAGGGYGHGYWYGPLETIRFTFATDEPVYPLRISSVSAQDQTRITLYVRARSRMTCEGVRTDYANRIGATELDYIREDYPDLGAHLHDGCFLTKLVTTIDASEMPADLYLVPAPTDEEFRRIEYASALPASDLLLLATAGLFFARSLRRKPRKANAVG